MSAASAVQATPPFPLAGEIASLGAALIWSLTMSTFTRFGTSIPSASLNLYKNIVAIVCLAIAAIILQPELPHDPWLYVWLAASGIIGLSLGDTALFAALKQLGAQITSASQCLAPPIAAIIAALFLSETLTPFELVGMLVTTFGIAAIIYFSRRGGSAQLAHLSKKQLSLGLGFAVLSATCQATGLVISRHALQDVNVVVGTMMRITPAILVLWTTMLISGNRASLAPIFQTRRHAVYITIASFGGTFLGLLLMSVGAKYAKAGIAAALTSTYPVWIIPIARFVLKERVGWRSAACTLVAVVGIILMMVVNV